MLTLCWQPLYATMLSNLEQMFDNLTTKYRHFLNFVLSQNELSMQTLLPFQSKQGLHQHKTLQVVTFSSGSFQQNWQVFPFPRPKDAQFSTNFHKLALSQTLFVFRRQNNCEIICVLSAKSPIG